ncbi:AmmeMemoRadiSam system protein B [soil metagenome]
MATLDRPKLRPMSPRSFRHEGQDFVALIDPSGVVTAPVSVPLAGFQHVIRHFDGQTALTEIQARVLRSTGQLLPASDLQRLVEQLDQAMVLDGPTFSAFLDDYRQQLIRPSAFAGRSYAGTERALRAQLAQLFVDQRGAGFPEIDSRIEPEIESSGLLRAVLVPHIDFARGGTVYTHAYKALIEQSEAETFVILGVAHQPCRQRFVLTHKDFETPLGLARTDRAFVDRLVNVVGDHLQADELVHRAEHSIEFQVVFLQYLLGERRDFSIVPILVGSFHDLMEQGIDPITHPEVGQFVEALRAAESACSGKVAYIGSIDLGHIGREFGDPDLIDDRTLDRLRSFDEAMLGHAEAGDPGAWFRTAAAVGDCWRTCGLSATYTLLHAIGPSTGRLLKYDQAVDDARTCVVSFASLELKQRTHS